MGAVQNHGKGNRALLKGRLSAALLALLLAAHPSVPARPAKSIAQYSHDSWQTDRGLPQNSVSSIVQTPDGYLWLGTLEGLVRFDGVEFTVFNRRNTPAMRSNRVLALCTDHEGTLWAGFEDGGLLSMRQGIFRSADEIPQVTVLSLCEDTAHNLWIGTSGSGLFALPHGGKAVRFAKGDGLPGMTVNALCVDEAGSVWAGTEGGLGRYQHGDWKTVFGADGADGAGGDASDGGSNGGIVMSLAAQGSELWIGLTKGLVRYDSRGVKLFTTADGLTNPFIWSLRTLRDGSLVAGTQGGGLNLLRRGTCTRFTTREGLTSDVVWSLFEDAEGNIWAGTNGGGLNRLRNGSFTAFTTREGLANDFVWSLCEGPGGSLWAGTYNGLSRYDGNTFTTYSTRNGLPSDFVWSVLADAGGTIWAGTSNGLAELPPGGRWRTYGMKDGLGSAVIRVLYEDSKGWLWAGTTAGLSRLNGGRFETLRDGLPDGVVMSLCEDRDGSLLIGTGRGLARCTRGAIAPLIDVPGLPHSPIRALYTDADGNLWIGTQGNGLVLRRGETYFGFTPEQGLGDDVISEILEDGHGMLWLSSNRGIFRVARSDLISYAAGKSRGYSVTAFGEADGMMSRECNGSSQPAGCRTADGRLWFPTIRGIATVNPDELLFNTVAPPVIIERAAIDNVAKNTLEPVVGEPGRGELEIHYTGLSFQAPGRVRFRYKLEGYDRDWVEAGTRRDAYYTNLPPGTYTFRVKACNNDGIWNEGGDFLRVELKPHYYQQIWFYALCVLAAGAAVATAYRYRIRSLRAREAKLITLVVDRTKHLARETDNAERARREAERLKELAQEANKVKTELLNIAAHDLKSPLVSIKMLAKIIIEERGAAGHVADFAADIYGSAVRMHGLVSELLESAWIESGNLALRMKHVDLAGLTETVVCDNRVPAAQKKQDIVFRPATGCIVIGDEERLREVLDNLVSNAVKYSPLEKSIHVSVKPLREWVRIEVKDEGPGLTEEDKGRVFGKFQKLSAQPTAGEPSTGLGLAIVKQLVELHDGKVGVESRPGRGATFLVDLPKAAG